MSEKKAIREQLMAREAALETEYVAESNRGIAENLSALREFQEAKTILFFYSTWNEPDTHELVRRALADGKTVAMPESLPRGIMVARKICSLDELAPGRYGIMSPPPDAPELAPEDIDFIVVPSVAFDRDGYRIGHGGGYYDRYMIRTDAFRCGIAREQMIVERVPRDEYDLRVDCVVTEKNCTRFER